MDRFIHIPIVSHLISHMKESNTNTSVKVDLQSISVFFFFNAKCAPRFWSGHFSWKFPHQVAFVTCPSVFVLLIFSYGVRPFSSLFHFSWVHHCFHPIFTATILTRDLHHMASKKTRIWNGKCISPNGNACPCANRQTPQLYTFPKHNNICI